MGLTYNSQDCYDQDGGEITQGEKATCEDGYCCYSNMDFEPETKPQSSMFETTTPESSMFEPAPVSSIFEPEPEPMWGSCDSNCGGRSNGNCWCDSICQSLDDCCEDFSSVCSSRRELDEAENTVRNSRRKLIK